MVGFLKKMADRTRVEEYYTNGGFRDLPIFPGNLTNFGYWKNITRKGAITLKQKIQASKNLYNFVLKKLAIDSQDIVLEVGCGRGQGLDIIANYSPHKIIGIDASQPQLDCCRDKRRVLRAYAESLPFADESIDAIVSMEAIQHFYDVKAFAKESCRVLSPAGRIGVCSFFGTRNDSNELLKNYIPTIDDGIDVAYPIQYVKRCLEESGFAIKVESIGGQVWDMFQRWCMQVDPRREKPFKAFEAYKEGLWDYMVITGMKNSSQSCHGSHTSRKSFKKFGIVISRPKK